MTDSGPLVVADEWHVTLLVGSRASPRSVRRWCELTYEILTAAALDAEARLGPRGAGVRIRVGGGAQRNGPPRPP